MIKLTFITGAGMRRVSIDGKSVTFITSELGETPLIVDLEKLDDKKMLDTIKKAKMDKDILKELKDLQSEEEIAHDIKIDFQKNGWRLYRKECL